MEDSNIFKFGGVAAIALALAYAATGIAFLAQPAELQGSAPEVFWTTLAQQPTAHLIVHWASVATGLLGLAVVPAAAKLVYVKRPGLVLWSSSLAMLGFAMTARGNLMEVAFDRRMIPLYLDADEATRQAIHAIAGLALDVPDGLLTFGAVGSWILVVCGLALGDTLPENRPSSGTLQTGRRLSKALCYLGIATGLAFFLGVVGFMTLNGLLITLAAGLGGIILAPVWCFWLGISLYRN